MRLLVSSSIYGTDDCNAANAVYEKIYNETSKSSSTLNAASFLIKKTTSYYTYSHQKYWVVDGKSVGLSTGNMSPSDFNNQTASADKEKRFPPHGETGWTRLNRDLTVCEFGRG